MTFNLETKSEKVTKFFSLVFIYLPIYCYLQLSRLGRHALLISVEETRLLPLKHVGSFIVHILIRQLKLERGD